jgi:hypothetical protein
MSIRDQAKVCFQKGKFGAAADACGCPQCTLPSLPVLRMRTAFEITPEWSPAAGKCQ